MFWVIRWTDEQTHDDREIVVEAQSRLAAETMALKRNIPVVFLGPADDAEVEAAKKRKMLWKYTPAPKYTCLGQPVNARQVTCLMLCGVWTMLALLHNAHYYVIDMPFHVMSKL